MLLALQQGRQMHWKGHWASTRSPEAYGALYLSQAAGDADRGQFTLTYEGGYLNGGQRVLDAVTGPWCARLCDADADADTAGNERQLPEFRAMPAEPTSADEGIGAVFTVCRLSGSTMAGTYQTDRDADVGTFELRRVATAVGFPLPQDVAPASSPCVLL